ncbi:MAG: sensor histidine kinase [Rhizobium sp.]|nr:sensor histidine kinase [Rhizobium sp.]
MVKRFLWHAHDLGEENLNSFFISALVDMRASLILQNDEMDYLCVTGLPDCWTVDKDSVPADIAIFGPEIGAQLMASKQRALKKGVTEQLEVRLGEDRTFEFRILAMPARSGENQVITTIIDRSEDRRREKVLQQLLREVSHRSKNLLAIIQSIATQTSQHSDSIETYVQKFRGRVFSLSRSQDLITDSGWRGAHVQELLEQQVGSYINGRTEIVRFTGENTLLSPNAAMHIGLAFHELVINAITHGEILRRDGRIDVESAISLDETGKQLTLTWDERTAAGRPSETPAIPATRFGRAILERVVPTSVGGVAAYSLGTAGVRYRIRFPLGND